MTAVELERLAATALAKNQGLSEPTERQVNVFLTDARAVLTAVVPVVVEKCAKEAHRVVRRWQPGSCVVYVSEAVHAVAGELLTEEP